METVKAPVFYVWDEIVSKWTKTQAWLVRDLVLVRPFQTLISRGRLVDLWEDPSSLNMSGLSKKKKKLLAPLCVSKQSVSPGLCDSRASHTFCILVTFCSHMCCFLIYLLHLELYTLSVFLVFCLFWWHLLFLSGTFSIIHQLLWTFRYISHLLSVTPTHLSSQTSLFLWFSEYEIHTYHAQVDWRVGLWHRQIIERIQQVIQVIFLQETNKQRGKKT